MHVIPAVLSSVLCPLLTLSHVVVTVVLNRVSLSDKTRRDVPLKAAAWLRPHVAHDGTGGAVRELRAAPHTERRVM